MRNEETAQIDFKLPFINYLSINRLWAHHFSAIKRIRKDYIQLKYCVKQTEEVTLRFKKRLFQYDSSCFTWQKNLLNTPFSQRNILEKSTHHIRQNTVTSIFGWVKPTQLVLILTYTTIKAIMILIKTKFFFLLRFQFLLLISIMYIIIKMYKESSWKVVGKWYIISHINYGWILLLLWLNGFFLGGGQTGIRGHLSWVATF